MHANDDVSREPDAFVDTRLYVSVRPQVEYVAQELGAEIHHLILGDTDLAAVRSIVSECMDRNPDTSDLYRDSTSHLSQDDDTISADAAVSALRAQMDLVHDLTIEHVLDLVNRWVRFLKSTRCKVNNLLVRCKHRKDEVDKTYRTQSSSTRQNTQYRKEIQGIHQDFEACLQRLREEKLPVCARPQELSDACMEMRKMVSKLRGTQTTSTIVRLRDSFQYRLHRKQRKVFDQFLAAVEEHLV